MNNYLNVIMLVVFVAFLGYEGYHTLKTFRKHEEIMKETLANHKNAKVCKDYFKWNILYILLGALAIIMAFFSYIQGETLEMLVFIFFFIFTFVLMMQMMVSKTVVFYDSGFMYNLKHYKYRFVTHIGEDKNKLKGIPVKVTGEDQILLSKKVIDELKAHIEAYKKRKQENLEARKTVRKEGKK